MQPFLKPTGYLFANYMWYADYKGVSHAERTVAIAHSVIRPAFREALELVELVGDETAVAAADLHDVLEARRPCAALACEDRARRVREQIRKRHRAFRVMVLESGLLVDAFLALRALEVAPFL